MTKGYRRTITIDFDSSQVGKGADNVRAAMRELDSEFRKGSAEIERYGKNSQKLGLEKDVLTKKIELQEQKVSQLQKKYEESVEKLGEYHKSTLKAKTELNDSEAALGKLQDRYVKVTDEIEKQSGALGRFATNVEDFKKKVKDAGVDLDKLADNFIKIGTVLTGVSVGAASMSMNFDKEMSKVIAATGRTGDDIKDLRNIIINTSNQYGISAADMATAAQRVAWDWDNAAQKLDNAARLSVVGVTDVTTAVKLLESVATAYGSTIEEQTLLVDKLMVAYQKGEFSMGELGDSFGKVASIAAESGVSIDELLAIISSSTNVGVSASEAVTSLRQVISSIVKPSKEATDTAERLGIKFNAAALESKGLAGILEDVRKRTRGNTDEMAKLFGNVTALSQVMSISGSDNEYYKETLEDIRKAGGQANQTLKDMQTPAKDLSDAINRLKNMMIEGGSSFDGVIKAASKFVDFIAGMPPGVMTAIGVLGGLMITLGGIAKLILNIETVSKALAVVKAFLFPMTVAETGANIALTGSQAAAAAGGKLLAVVNSMLGTSFTSLLVPMLIVLAIIAAITIAIALLTGRSKDASNALNESTRDMSQSLAQTQRDVNNSINNIQNNSNNLPRYARGTSYHRGGRAIVGEEGPELVDLPAGSRVYSAARTRRMADGSDNGGNVSYNNIYLTVQARDINEKNAFEEFLMNLQQGIRKGAIA